MISAEVHERNITEVPNVPTSTVATTSVVHDVEPTSTSSPRISLPEGSLSRPAVIATCRPRTWMQQITEGQTNEPAREGDSDESNTSDGNITFEDIPDELGHEWRVLHPFVLPGVRFPTDSTPRNQRRLAENDALVELIQTTEYLDDVPTWGQRDYRLYPTQYGDPFYRGRGRGRREWFTERPTERSHGGLGRGSSHVNGREVSQVPTVRTQQERQEEGRSELSNIERREDERERCESSRVPPAPPPTEDQFFMDWSSVDSPRERTSSHSATARNTLQPESQTVQSGPEPARIEATGNILSDVMTSPSTSRQLNQVGPRLIDRETNTSDIGGRSQGEEMRIQDSDNRNIPMPISHSGLSSYDTELTEGSHMTTCEIMPQLDGLMSVHSGKRIVRSVRTEQKTFQKLL